MGKDVKGAITGEVRKGKLKKQTRIEALRKEKERLARLRDAAAKRDLLDEYAAFRHYDRQGVVAELTSVPGCELCEADIERCIELQRANVGDNDTLEAWDEASARTALQHEESRLILIKGELEEEESPPQQDEEQDDWVLVPSEARSLLDTKPIAASGAESGNEPALLGYLHLQFCIREQEAGKVPLLCVLNMQLIPSTMGKGLGKFALQLCDLIARRNGMELVMLYMQDGAVKAMRLSKQKQQAVEGVPAAPLGVQGGAHVDDDDTEFEVISRPQCGALAVAPPLLAVS